MDEQQCIKKCKELEEARKVLSDMAHALTTQRWEINSLINQIELEYAQEHALYHVDDTFTDEKGLVRTISTVSANQDSFEKKMEIKYTMDFNQMYTYLTEEELVKKINAGEYTPATDPIQLPKTFIVQKIKHVRENTFFAASRSLCILFSISSFRTDHLLDEIKKKDAGERKLAMKLKKERYSRDCKYALYSYPPEEAPNKRSPFRANAEILKVGKDKIDFVEELLS